MWLCHFPQPAGGTRTCWKGFFFNLFWGGIIKIGRDSLHLHDRPEGLCGDSDKHLLDLINML